MDRCSSSSPTRPARFTTTSCVPSLGVSVQYAVAAAREIETAIASAFAPQPTSLPEPERPTVALVPALPRGRGAGANAKQDGGEQIPRLTSSRRSGTPCRSEPPRSTSRRVVRSRDHGAHRRECSASSRACRTTIGSRRSWDASWASTSRTRPDRSIGTECRSRSRRTRPRWRLPSFRRHVGRGSLSASSTSSHRSHPSPTSFPTRPNVRRSRTPSPGPAVCSSFCGTPGSSLTTTLYAALRELDTSELNVLTIEDPVERRLEGIAQVEVDPTAGVTVASALRAVLASDPDVVAMGKRCR